MIYELLLLLVLAGDQTIKFWISHHLALYQTKSLIPNVFSLTFLKNNGAAYSMLQGKMWFFYIITFIAIGVIGWLFWTSSKKEYLYRIGLTLILAGAIGNFIDRVRLHYVVDMFQLDFINFPIFNLADLSLTIGVVLVFVYFVWIEGRKKA